MTAPPLHVLLLTGLPGVGKTTIIRAVAERLAGRRRAGFYTEEIREDGERAGFRAVTFDGGEAVIAHRSLRSRQRVGHYGVDVAAIDALAASTLGRGADVYLVDEIGKMECCSAVFVAAVRRLLDSPARVIATIGLRGGGFIAEVKQRSDVELWEVTRANREGTAERALGWLRARAGGELYRPA